MTYCGFLASSKFRTGGSSEMFVSKFGYPLEPTLDDVPYDIFFSIVTDDPLLDNAAVQYESRPF